MSIEIVVIECCLKERYVNESVEYNTPEGYNSVEKLNSFFFGPCGSIVKSIVSEHMLRT